MSMRVFLTGGTGLLGSHLAAELRAGDHEVVALHRRSADLDYVRSLGCETVQGDIRDDPDVLTKLMGGCTHVVHAAAVVYSGGAWPKVRAINVDGTRNVLTAAVQAGVAHAVHVSSVAVYGLGEGPVDEDTSSASDLPTGDLYARSKREAEEVARGIERVQGIPVTVVRPSAVYGERDRLMVPALQKLLRLPVMPMLGPGDNTLPVVYAGNVAAAIRLTLEAARGETTYDVAMDHPLTQRMLLTGLARGLGVGPTLVRIPARLVRGTSALAQWIGVGTPGAKHLPLERLTQLALGENPYPSKKIRAELGWDPPHRHEDALERSGRWAVDNPQKEY